MSHLAVWPPDELLCPEAVARLEAPEEKSRKRTLAAGQAIETESRTPVLFRHSGWARSRRLIGEALARTDQSPSRRTEFNDCGSHAYVLRSLDDPDQYRIAGSCCRDRFCLPCAIERASIIAGNVVELIGKRETRFLTLTVKCQPHDALRERLDHLYRSFQLLRRRALWKRKVTGGVAFTEIKWTKNGSWHPHLHCLIEGHYIERRKLQALWSVITGDSFIVDIRKPPDFATVTRYVTKYASKPFNNTFVNRPNQLDEAVLALAGRHLCVTFGRWRGIMLTKLPDEGAWEHVCELDTLIARAAHGNIEAQDILGRLTDRDLTPILERAPPKPTQPIAGPKPDVQCDWFGTWQHDGTYRYPVNW